MAQQQITAAQVAGGVGGGGAQQETKHISLAGGSADKTSAAFGFVVGLVYFEILSADSADANDVHTSGWVNMRSFGGTKTADVTNRRMRATGGGSHTYFDVDRTTSGTVLVISRPTVGTDIAIDGTGMASFTAFDWPNPGRIRITAIEDIQS